MINGNLKAEMTRCEISVADVATLLGCAEKTVRNKLSGQSSFTVPEAFKIKNTLFPNLTVEYLFFSDDCCANKTA